MTAPLEDFHYKFSPFLRRDRYGPMGTRVSRCAAAAIRIWPVNLFLLTAPNPASRQMGHFEHGPLLAHGHSSTASCHLHIRFNFLLYNMHPRAILAAVYKEYVRSVSFVSHLLLSVPCGIGRSPTTFHSQDSAMAGVLPCEDSALLLRVFLDSQADECVP